MPASEEKTPEQVAYLALLDGNTIEETREAIRTLLPGSDPGRAIAKAKDRFRLAAREDTEAITGWCLASARDLARKMQTVGDYAGALKAIKLIHDIAVRKTNEAIDL